ncbi:hypothetical protein RYX36_034627 [Vicia faba]
MFKVYYPERSGKLFIFHAPYMFMKVWKLIYPFIGDNTKKKGQSLYTGKELNKFYPIMYGEDIATSDASEESASCESGSLNSILANGKAILCFQSRSQQSTMTTVRIVMEVEAMSLIYAYFPTKDVDMSWDIPFVQVDFIAGTKILSYMEATRNPVIKFSKTRTVVGQQISPDVVFFSSLGPISLSPPVLKSDIVALVVTIQAALSPTSYSSLESDASQDDLSALNFKIKS